MQIEEEPYQLRPLSVGSNNVFTTESDNTSDSSIISDQVCFICCEKFNEHDNSLPENLNNFTFFSRDCSCEGDIHELCLCRWLMRSQTCPICRNPLQIIENRIIVDNSNNTVHQLSQHSFVANNNFPLPYRIVYFIFMTFIIILTILFLITYIEHD